MLILGFGGRRGAGTGAQLISKHTAGTSRLEYGATWCKEYGCADSYRNGTGWYYLEAALSLLDVPFEWFYDKKTHMLYYHGDTSHLRSKVGTYALSFDGHASHVTVANLTFFSAALSAYTGDDWVDNLRFESLNFSYPDSSRRMLQDLSPIDSMMVWTSAKVRETPVINVSPPVHVFRCRPAPKVTAVLNSCQT